MSGRDELPPAQTAVVPSATRADSITASAPSGDSFAAPVRGAHANPAGVATQLRAVDGGAAVPAGTVVVYDDMHGLHGGETITVRGDGSVTAIGKRAPWSGERRAKLATEELRGLIGLLVEIAAWEQRVPERAPVPDESRATLSIETGGSRSNIWEWYSDLRADARIVRIKELLERAIAAG